VEVVEQPLGSGRDAFATGVLRKRAVGIPQDARVLLEAAQMRAAVAAAPPREREQRRQPARVLLERLDSE
jgi:hypothetical protein